MSDQFKQEPSIKKRHVAFAALLGCSVTQLANYQFGGAQTGSFVQSDAPAQVFRREDNHLENLASKYYQEPASPIGDQLAKAVNYGDSGCTSSSPCGVGGGDCDSDNDCLPGLKCFQTNSGASVPGIDTYSLMAIGISTHDWCYDPNWSGLMPAYNRGGSGCTAQSPCGIGQGDCDSDADCQGSLKCFQTDSGASVPGIDTASLMAIGDPTHDWCYDPAWDGEMRAWNKGGSGCTPQSPCGIGQGDCDSDSDCQGSLKCFQTETGQAAPGINFESIQDIGIDTNDYCYDPSN